MAKKKQKLEGKLKVMICTPTHGGMVHESYMMGLMMLKSDPEVKENYDLYFNIASGVSNITAGRNTMFTHFIKSPCDVLMWIDADTGFNPQNFLSVMNRLRGGDDSCTIVQAKKVFSEDRFIELASSGENLVHRGACFGFNSNTVYQENKNYYVEETGFGFYAVTRRACDLIAEYCYKSGYIELGESESDIITYCPHLPMRNNGRYLSEDFSFCKRMRSKDLNIGVVFEEIGHIGNFDYRANFGELLAYQIDRKNRGLK